MRRDQRATEVARHEVDADVGVGGLGEIQRHLEGNVAENDELLTQLLDLGDGHVAERGRAGRPHIALARTLDGELEEEVRVDIGRVAYYNGRGRSVGIKDRIRYFQSES